MALNAVPDLTCPIEAGEVDEPLIIESKISRQAAAAGLSIFSLIWNLIFGTLTYMSVTNGNWFPFIFMLIVNIIGISSIVLAIYATMQVFNPVPVLVLSQRNIYAGSEFEVSWLFKGNTRCISKLKIILDGKENVSYREGTSTRKEESLFFSKTIIDTTDQAEIVKGFQLVSLPIDTMHSFASLNNSIDWRLTIKGSIPRWPDINDEFPLVVLAPPIGTEEHVES